MIIVPDSCSTCGNLPMPTQVTCDECEREQTIDDFVGVVLHFSKDDDSEECDNDCESCGCEISEFHFCDVKCLSEYIADPNNDCFSSYEGHVMTMYVDPVHVGTLLSCIREM